MLAVKQAFAFQGVQDWSEDCKEGNKPQSRVCELFAKPSDPERTDRVMPEKV